MQDSIDLSKTILVVEDELLVRMMAVDIMLEAGFRVLEASNADQAVELLRSKHVDLLFTDVRMPGSMDGVELAELVSREFDDLPTVLSSGHLSEARIPAGTRFVAKPYDPEHVTRVVVKALQSAGGKNDS